MEEKDIQKLETTWRTKLMKVVGIFKSSNTFTDKSKSYMNLAAAQQLQGKGPNYVTDIYVDIKDPEQASNY